MPFIKFKIYPEIEVVLVFYFGAISKECIDEHLNRLTSDKDYNPNYNVISDISNADLLLSNSELNSTVRKVSDKKVTVGKRKQAFIIKSSSQQAISSIFSMMVRNLPMKISIVKSKREACEWIDVNPDFFDFINHEIDSFKET